MQLDRLEIKEDERGRLVEAFKFPNDGQLFYVTIEPGQTRGDHYHERKLERFLVVQGSAVMTVGDNVFAVDSNQPRVVTVFPPNKHKIYSKDGCIVLVWVNEIFDENDTDTYSL